MVVVSEVVMVVVLDIMPLWTVLVLSLDLVVD